MMAIQRAQDWFSVGSGVIVWRIEKRLVRASKICLFFKF